MPWRKEKVAVIPSAGDPDWAAISQRQEEVINACVAELKADKESRPISATCIFIYPCGSVRTKVVGLEPEHVQPVLDALDVLRARMQEFLQDALDGGKVIPIKR